jgi:hypothetical protein
VWGGLRRLGASVHALVKRKDLGEFVLENPTRKLFDFFLLT